MAAVMNYQFEDSALDQMITALCVLPAQMIDALVCGLAWLIRSVVFTVAENGASVAKMAGAIAVTVVLATQPQIAIAVALALIVAYGWMTHV